MDGPLPLDSRLAEIRSLLRSHRRLIVTAPPGAGKTTRVPPALVADGPVILLQPRRIAARAIAGRIAREQGWRLGGEVGWQVRFERRFGSDTRLLVATEGILTGRLQADPLLGDFKTVILDEFHERSIHSELALALLKQTMAAREDLQLVVMSATLEAAPVAAFLDDCPVVAADSRTYPVEVGYADSLSPAAAIRDAIRREGGHLLCFLPGAGEITALSRQLAGGLPPGAALFHLHGSLDAESQDRALAPFDGRKIILATNIAETSLTVEGVTDVVDCGYHRLMRYDPARGIDRLQLERVSQDCADQRAGRAGRVGPGRCLRLWDPRLQLNPAREPEIRRIDLAAPFLSVYAWGGNPLDLDWFERPPAHQAEAAIEVLERLGAVRGGRLTELGTAAQRLPVHPRLACVLIAAGGSERAARLCAALAERERVRGDGSATSCDLLPLLDDPALLTPELRRIAGELNRLAGRQLGKARGDCPDEVLLKAMLAGFPDRVAWRRAPGSDRLLLASGHGARQARESGVREGEFLVALEVLAASERQPAEALVTKASLVRREWLQPTEVVVEHSLDPDHEEVKAVEKGMYGRLTLFERSTTPDPGQAAELLVGELERRGLDPQSQCLLWRAERAGVVIDVEAARRRACAGRTRLPRLDLARRLPPEERRQLERLCPESLELPGGRRVRLDYGKDAVKLSAKVQDLFGLWETPAVGIQKEPVLIEILAPNGRPVQATRDLTGFWKTTYPQVRRELRGRYPKHSWPEHPRVPAGESRHRRQGGSSR